jgi:hypothetical protein
MTIGKSSLSVIGMSPLMKASMASGLLIYFVSVTGIMAGEEEAVMLFNMAVPALLYFIILSFFTKKSSTRRRVFFVIVSMVLYVFAMYLINLATPYINWPPSPFIYLLILTTASIVLQMVYDLIFRLSVSLSESIIVPGLIGAIASTGTCVSILLIEQFDDTDKINKLLFALAFFSVYPLFHLLFSKNLERRILRLSS